MKKTLGQMIRETRISKDMTQKHLAEKVKKEDGKPITPQYLNDIEHDRRSPSEFVARQIAKELELDADYLIFLSGSVPKDILQRPMSEETVQEAFRVFRKKQG
jgi:transcriptional regulator with XRE-family HTH domain